MYRILALVVFAVCVSAQVPQTGDKTPWRPLLSKRIYQELAQREADIIRERLDGNPEQKALNRAKYGAAMIAALTLSMEKDAVPDEELRGTRASALELAELLSNKGPLDGAKKLAATLPHPQPGAGIQSADRDWTGLLQHPDLMDHFRPKAKGGDGLHPDLQSNIRLKGALNCVEDKVRALAMKELTDSGIKIEAKELELLGYRIAVAGSLQHDFVPAPKDGKDFAPIWQTLSAQMRDHGFRVGHRG